MPRVTLSYDTIGDTLYVKEAGAVVVYSKPLSDDGFVVLNTDTTGRVVGLQLLDASIVTQTMWRMFFHGIPLHLYAKVDDWLTL